MNNLARNPNSLATTSTSRFTLALALLALTLGACESAATSNSAHPADAPHAMSVTDIEQLELDHLSKVPGSDAAVLARVHEHSSFAAEFERQARTLRPLAADAVASSYPSVSGEWAVALACPYSPSQKPVLEHLARDRNRDVATAARDALTLSGSFDSSWNAKPDDLTEFELTRNRWESFRREPMPGRTNALLAFAGADVHPHFKTHAALALAEIGDMRAVPFLAQRLRQDTLQLYSEAKVAERALRRDDLERRQVARAIIGLTKIHPDQREVLRSQLEDALLAWVKEGRWPSPIGLDALAALGSAKALPDLRLWAFPDTALPTETDEEPNLHAFLVAESALRAVGRLRDERSFSRLVMQLTRRPAKLDLSSAHSSRDAAARANQAENRAISGAVSVLAIGAASGLAEWGDPRGYAPLLKYTQDALNADGALFVACSALVQLDPNPAELLDHVLSLPRARPAEGFHAYCLLHGFESRPLKNFRLWSVLQSDNDFFRVSAAVILGKAGLSAQESRSLLARAPQDKRGKELLALVALLGADAESAGQAVLMAPDAGSGTSDLRRLWRSVLGPVSLADLDNGLIFRMVRNAFAASRTLVHSGGEPWPVADLPQMLNDEWVRIPDAAVRTELSARLMRIATTAADEPRRAAIWTLAVMRARGQLLSLLCSDPADESHAPLPESARNTVRAALRFIERGVLPEE